MSLLDHTDLFRSCQPQIQDGVSTEFASTENSIYQAQRTPEARLLSGQKRENEAAVRDRENLESTISEDLTDGQVVKLDPSLKLLCEDDMKLLLPSDELEDAKPRIIEKDSDFPRGNPVHPLLLHDRMEQEFPAASTRNFERLCALFSKQGATQRSCHALGDPDEF